MEFVDGLLGMKLTGQMEWAASWNRLGTETRIDIGGVRVIAMFMRAAHKHGGDCALSNAANTRSYGSP